MEDPGKHGVNASFAGWAEVFEGPAPIRSLAAALGVGAEPDASAAKLLLPELDPDAPLAASANELGTAIRAFEGFQDLLEVTLEADVPHTHRHYCYFEAVIYIREVGRCLLSGHVLGALTLLRPFLELATLHIYWRSLDDGYIRYYRWFKDGVAKPPFKTYLNEIFRKLETVESAGPTRVKALRNQLYGLYRVLCSYSHVASLENSIITLSGGTRTSTIESTSIALAQANLVLRQILLLYGLAYPMILFPRNIVQKFGFSGPMGMFSYHEISALYEASLGEPNVRRLRDLLSNHIRVTERLEWYGNLPDLTDERIQKTWTDLVEHMRVSNVPTELRARQAVSRAQFRSLNWAMNYIGAPHPFEGMDDPALDDLAPKVMDW